MIDFNPSYMTTSLEQRKILLSYIDVILLSLTKLCMLTVYSLVMIIFVGLECIDNFLFDVFDVGRCF